MVIVAVIVVVEEEEDGRRREEGRGEGGGVPTWTGLDTGGAVGELGVGVADQLVDLAVVQCERRTGVLAGAVVVEVPAGLQRKHRARGCILSLHPLATRRRLFFFLQVGLTR